jgi:hypothetical protein
VRRGTTWLITKKTNDDLFLLRPDRSVNLILLYTLLLKAKKYGLLLHDFVFMTNHFHLVVTDVRGTLPAFMREFLSESGKALKVALKTTRRIWSGDRYGSTELLDRDAAERFMVYTRVNPTDAGLTDPEEWPGVTSARWQYGDTIEAKRPDVYFDPRTRPARVCGVLEPLGEQVGRVEGRTEQIEGEEGAPSKGDTARCTDVEKSVRKNRAREQERHRRRCAALQKTIDQRTREAIEKIHQRMRNSKDNPRRRLAGANRVLQVSRMRRGNHEYGRLIPRFATRDRERMLAAILEHGEFLAKHEEARQRFARGDARAEFPCGTYGYRERFGVRIAKGGAAA